MNDVEGGDQLSACPCAARRSHGMSIRGDGLVTWLTTRVFHVWNPRRTEKGVERAHV